MASFRSLKSEVYDREERKQQYQSHIRGLNAYDRHKKFVEDYVSHYGKGRPSIEKLPIRTDQDALREGYRFIRSEEDDMDTSWEQRLVKRYYDKLFKEYCIADMSKYKSGKVGLRWRTEKEVMTGKGQFICGNKHCDEKVDLASYEVNFAYFEAGESKQALVKLVACNRCAEKLHYRRRKEKEQLERKEKEEFEKKRERWTSEDSDTDNEYKANDDRKRKDRRRSEDGGAGSEYKANDDRKRKDRTHSEDGGTDNEYKAYYDRKRKDRRRSEDGGTDNECKANDDRRRKDRRLSEDGGTRERRAHEKTRERSDLGSPDESLKNREESRRKGKEKETSADGNETKNDDETFDEFLEGMFP